MGLRLTLFAVASYVGLFGLLFLFALDLAVDLLAITVHDPVPFRQWGTVLLVLAAVVGLVASDPVRHARLLVVPLFGLGLDTLVIGYELATGTSTLRQFGVPLALNLMFLALLAWFYPRGGRVTEELDPADPSGERWLRFLRRKGSQDPDSGHAVH